LDASALAKLVTELLIAIQAMSGYPAPDEHPAVQRVPQAWLERQVCDRPCEVYGWFPPGKVVYMDDRMDPLHDLAARSILLHELVHFLQQENGAFREHVRCRVWNEREKEAYLIQYRWLARQSAPPSTYWRLSQRPALGACRDER